MIRVDVMPIKFFIILLYCFGDSDKLGESRQVAAHAPRRVYLISQEGKMMIERYFIGEDGVEHYVSCGHPVEFFSFNLPIYRMGRIPIPAEYGIWRVVLDESKPFGYYGIGENIMPCPECLIKKSLKERTARG